MFKIMRHLTTKTLSTPSTLDAPVELTHAVKIWCAIAVVWSLLCHALLQFDLMISIALSNSLLFLGVQCLILKYPYLIAKPFDRVPQRILRNLPTFFAAIGLGLVAWTYQTLLGMQAGLACLGILLTFKLWECRRARDIQVLVGLNFFLLLGTFLRQESALTLASVIVGAVITLSAWVSFHAQTWSNSLEPTQTSWTYPLKETLRLSLLGIPLAVCLFFVFPRIAGPLWGLPEDASRSRMGLSDSLEPGKFAQLAGNDEIALRAKFNTNAPSAKQLYWRGPVLSFFDGITWRALPNLALFSPNLNTIDATQLSTYTLVSEPHKQTFRALLDSPVQASAGIMIDLQASPKGKPLLERETITTSSDLQANLINSSLLNTLSHFSNTQKRLYLQPELALPANSNPKTLAYAYELREQLGVNVQDPTVFIQAILNMYYTQFSYTLQPPKPNGRVEDAIDGFLFQTKSGYCEHFAASFVTLMRALDFPARIVTGYQGGEFNPKDGWYTIRQSDAHAWAEVLHPNQGWIRVDPTAAVAPWRVEAGGSSLLSTAGKAPTGLGALGQMTKQALLPLRQWAEASMRIWQDYGLNYGKDRQLELFNRFGFSNIDSAAIASLLGGALGVWLLFMLFVHRTRKDKPKEHLRALHTFDRFCKTLKLPRLPSQTPRQWYIAHKHLLTPKQDHAVLQWLTIYEYRLFASHPTNTVIPNFPTL